MSTHWIFTNTNNNMIGPGFVGVVSCAETLSADSQNLKTLFLARLIKEASCGLKTCTTSSCMQPESSNVVEVNRVFIIVKEL